MNPHFRALEAAYQLHCYFCFRTHYLRPIFSSDEDSSFFEDVLSDVCSREDYHLLETEIAPENLRLLLSLKPDQTVSKTVNMLKGNLSRQFNLKFPGRLDEHQSNSLWAKGYFAHSSGKVNLDHARQYVASQIQHHGYQGEWTKKLKYQNPRYKSPAFEFEHCFCLLNYHVVMTTQNRIPVFDEAMTPRLFDYIVKVGAKHKFAIDRIGLLPDHMHVILEAVPSVSIEECVRAILENTRHWMTTRYSGVLKQTGAWDVWQPSYYAGTVGEYSTAQVKEFLRGRVG